MTFIDVFFISSLLIFVITLTVYMRTLEDKAKKTLFNSLGDKKCPPHKWNYETQTSVNGSTVEFMICKNCRMRPGMIPTSYDKPY